MIKKGDIINVVVKDFAFGGKGIATYKVDDKSIIVFINQGIPGQQLNVLIKKKKPTFLEAEIIEIITPSKLENKVPYQRISGAPYISLSINDQRSMKEQVCFDVYKRIGKIEHIETLYDEWIPSPSPHHYRNKMEYSFSCIQYDLEKELVIDDAFALGFKRKGTWWMVENLDKDSGMFDKELEDSLHQVRSFLEKTNLKAWHPPKKTGFFRHLVVRKSYLTNHLLFNLVTSSKGLDQFNHMEFGGYLEQLFKSRFRGLIHTINDDVADREKLDKGNSQLVKGNLIITEKINDLNFDISMQSFFQTNPNCAEKLYEKVMQYIRLEKIPSDSYILDLFCGTGTIGQLIAKSFPDANIIGVDIVKSAIENASINATKNNISNITFKCDDVGKFLLNNPNYENKIHTIVIDPPRAGISPKSLRKVIRLNAKKIVYVSCNPATQARDLETLSSMGYSLIKFSLADQFPHTAHVESIMLFSQNQE